jgi:hypothetical protein
MVETGQQGEIFPKRHLAQSWQKAVYVFYSEVFEEPEKKERGR